jgi:hypothetical protein
VLVSKGVRVNELTNSSRYGNVLSLNEMRWLEMIRVVIDVIEGATPSKVVAQAKSLREAVSIAAAVYPTAEVRVEFPIDAEAFFVRDGAARAEISSMERAEEIAAWANSNTEQSRMLRERALKRALHRVGALACRVKKGRLWKRGVAAWGQWGGTDERGHFYESAMVLLAKAGRVSFDEPQKWKAGVERWEGERSYYWLRWRWF